MEELALISQARSHGKRIAFRCGLKEVAYDTVLRRSESIAVALLAGADDLEESRVAFLVPPGADYSVVQWGIWRAGGIAVPLCLSATQSEWEYTLSDAQVNLLVVASSMAEKIQPLVERLQIRLIRSNDVPESEADALPELKGNRRAMILYTSGTTSKPKGVVTTHANIQAQIESLVEAWQWRSDDRIPLFLPLHHIHGIINILSCALWSGATIEPFPRFEMTTILSRVQADAFSVFMAVPTIYVKLIAALEGCSEDERERIVFGFQRMRLMISGSAALPASIHEKWTKLTGQKLLERYGMTEIGMALSNPFEGERRPGAVGVALPGVQIRLKSEKGDLIVKEDESGEIQVRGCSVSAEYWNRPEITTESFDQGWFRTGDVAVLEQGYYRIMGRLSVDIIKSGGYKLSALEIEAVLLEHPDISECAVIGVADETWGEAVAAAVVLIGGATLELGLLRDWCRERMSVYKMPHRLAVVEQLPRNAMGKVTKPKVRDFFLSD